MAAQRTPGREGTSPAQARGSQGRETPHEGSAHITETARHVGETASQSDAQGRPQRAGWAQALEEHIDGPSRGHPWCWPRGVVCSWDASGGKSWGPGAAPREREKRTTRPARRS